MFKRLWIVAMMMSFIMLIYVLRLAWLQIVPDHMAAFLAGNQRIDSWKRGTVEQRQRSLVLDTGRGDFVDRYGNPITGETYMTAGFFPISRAARGSEEQISELAAVLKMSLADLKQFWDEVREPVFLKAERGSEANAGAEPIRLSKVQIEQIDSLGIHGIRVLPYRNRYLPQFEAKHVIGFTSEHPEWLREVYMKELETGKRKLNDQVGGSGLEKSLDHLLHGNGATSVSYFMDGLNTPLEGLDMRIHQSTNEYYPLQAVTTLDLHLQNALEAYADQQGLKEGAIVVLDANNADIIAMVSRPKLKQGQFMTSDGSEWRNNALTAVAPGSIYKLVTAAAALETGVVHEEEVFECHGEYGKYGLFCWKKGGHGRITLKEGIAQSCNIVFATIAERLKGEQWWQIAKTLGVVDKVGWQSPFKKGPLAEPLRLLEEEEKGRLFAAEDARLVTDGGILAQSGIGQRDVRMTPLQAANLVVTLLHQGQAREPRIVSEIRYANGQQMVGLPSQLVKQDNKSWIRMNTARTILKGMEAVVDHGTGSYIRQGKWTLAGKSGTAETVKDGQDKNHQWFIGYGPIQQPKYAVAVLAANRPPASSSQATRLFRGVMDIAANTQASSGR